MATGYTHPVKDGKITTLKDFAYLCARNFGALATLRDDALTTNIPDEIAPNTKHHDEAIAGAKAELARLRGMSSKERRTGFIAACEEVARKNVELAANDRQAQLRYNEMRRLVAAWKPPSADHEGIKRFMLEQLEMSIKHDCPDDPYRFSVPESAESWWSERVRSESETLAYHENARTEEIKRAAERTKWIKALKASLGD